MLGWSLMCRAQHSFLQSVHLLPEMPPALPGEVLPLEPIHASSATRNRNKQEVTALNRSILKPLRTCPRPPTLPKEWASLTLPVGRSEHSWGIASGGALLSESERNCRFSSASQGCCFLKTNPARTYEIKRTFPSGARKIDRLRSSKPPLGAWILNKLISRLQRTTALASSLPQQAVAAAHHQDLS